MRRICVPLLTVMLFLLQADLASAKQLRLGPSDRAGARYTFDTGSLRGRGADVVSARLMVGSARRRSVSARSMRRAARRGSITLRVRRTRGRPVRLLVVVDGRTPSRPGKLKSSGSGASALLTWRAARDDVGIAAYQVSRGGKTVGTVRGTARSFVDAGLTPGRTYDYAVRAVDHVKNRSAPARTSVSIPAASAEAPQSVAPSGESPPNGDLPGWSLVFSDDFTTPVPLGSFPAAVSSRWTTYDEGSADTSGQGRHSPSRVLSVHDGTLDWFLHSEGGQPLVAAALPRLPGQQYGRYAVRFRSDPLPGYKVAWLLWPDSGIWPRDGEIDFPEGELDSTFCAFAHHLGASSGADQDAFCGLGSFNAWHTAIIEWVPGEIRFLLDGQVVARSTDRVPDTSLHWVFMSETSGMATPSSATQGHVVIDWVAAWRRG